MHSQPEHVELSPDLPVKAMLQSVRRCGMHFHNAIEFLLVLKGQLGLRIDSDVRYLGTGEVALIPSNQFHETFEMGSPNLVAAIQINPAIFERLDPEFCRREFRFGELAIRRPDAPCIQSIRSLLATTLWETRMQRPGWRLKVEACVMDLAVTLLREIPFVETKKRASVFELEDEGVGERLQRIVDYIYEHADESITLNETAYRERISTEYLSRLFKLRTNYTFKSFVTEVRIRRSLALLEVPGSKILDVALSSGFPNVKSYNAAFLKSYGCTPSEWKKSDSQAGTNPLSSESPYIPVDEHAAMALVRYYVDPSPIRL